MTDHTPDWVPFHEELAGRLMAFEDRQDEMLGFLRALEGEGHKVINLHDQTASGRLEQIDPFTFMASWNRGIAIESRLAIAAAARHFLSVQTPPPTSFIGISPFQFVASWFFVGADKRGEDDVAQLWQLARQAVAGDIDGDLFDACLAISGVGIAKLTSGLFWMAPRKYLAADHYSAAKGLQLIEGEDFEVGEGGLYGPQGRLHDWECYRSWLHELREHGVEDFVQFSRMAYLDKVNTPANDPGARETLGGVVAAATSGSQLVWSAIETGRSSSAVQLPRRTWRRYHTALSSGSFVLVGGPVGCGKTRLTEEYARLAGAEYLRVTSSPTWTSSADLLKRSEVASFLRRAAENWREHGRDAQAFHLVLDAINVARTEHVLADVLPLLDRRSDETSLPLDDKACDGLELAPNVAFVGTLSREASAHVPPGVLLDRAQVITVRPSREHLAEYCDGAPWTEVLLAVWELVRPVAPFGFRFVDETRAYLAAAEEIGIEWAEAFDEVLAQKVVPRLGGDHPRLSEIRRALANECGVRFPLTYAELQREL